MSDIARTRELLIERLTISLQDKLTKSQKERLAWINENIVVPPTEHYKYRNFDITFYPIEDEWAASQEGTCFYRQSQKEIYDLIDTILGENHG